MSKCAWCGRPMNGLASWGTFCSAKCRAQSGGKTRVEKAVLGTVSGLANTVQSVIDDAASEVAAHQQRRAALEQERNALEQELLERKSQLEQNKLALERERMVRDAFPGAKRLARLRELEEKRPLSDSEREELDRLEAEGEGIQREVDQRLETQVAAQKATESAGVAAQRIELARDGLTALAKAFPKTVFLCGKMPAEKWCNMTKSFLRGMQRDECIVAIDDTVFGSAEEGLAIALSGIYAKALWEKPFKLDWEVIAAAGDQVGPTEPGVRVNRRLIALGMDDDTRAFIAHLLKTLAALSGVERATFLASIRGETWFV